MSDPCYFDHAATTPLDIVAREAMESWLDQPGNSQSLHRTGQRANAAVEKARAQIAMAIGADSPEQIIFTSSATEANNLVLHSFENLAFSPFEHSAVRAFAVSRGATLLPNHGWDLGSIREPGLVSIIGTSNETGGEPTYNLESGLLHRDHSQTIRCRDFRISDEDFATFSSHKMGGPLGVACIYARDPSLLRPQLLGGGQEWGLRPGTLNVPAIAGFGAAFGLTRSFQLPTTLRHLLREGISSLEPYWFEAPSQNASIAALCLSGVLAESIVLDLDRKGFSVSSGPACSSVSTDPSPTLLALGLSPSEAMATVRISFGPTNTHESTKALASALILTVKSLTGLGEV